VKCPAVLAAVALLAACNGEAPEPEPEATDVPEELAGAGPIVGEGGIGTPMEERVAVLGVLNKRNGIVRDVALRPGQSARWKDLIVRLRACEKTAPWEQEQLTGAFVQVDVQRPDDSWGRVFSGWVFRESPSLNVVEHAVYDVWVKNCEMTFPAGEPAPGSEAARNSSRAPNSGGGNAAPSTPAVPADPPTAAESNAV